VDARVRETIDRDGAPGEIPDAGRAPARPAAVPPAPYRPQLDALRAVAVAAVLFQHTWVPDSPWGHLGVRLFFVLSGYLITGILLAAPRADRPRTLGSFYLRRALRLFPAYYVVLLASMALIPEVRATAGWHLAYATNLMLAAHDRWDPWQTSHFWSLAVEEQFYLLWAPLLLCAPRRWAPWIAAALVVAGPVFRAAVRLWDPAAVDAHVLLPASFDAFGVGALLALFGAGDVLGRLGARGLQAIALGGLAAFWLAHEAAGDSVLLFTLTETAALLPLAALVLGAARGDRGWLGRLFELRGVRAVGRISYGVYLFHVFLWWALKQAGPWLDDPGPLAFGVVSTCAVLVAAVSWRFLERPFNGLKARFPYARPIAA
jgi:peptidoglycan/LPS O-acetylase OafA/YrhL